MAAVTDTVVGARSSMTITTESDELITRKDSEPAGEVDVLVCLPTLSAEALDAIVGVVESAFNGQRVLFAAPAAAPRNFDARRWIGTPERGSLGWVLGAHEYSAAVELVATHSPKVTLLLGNCGEGCTGLDAMALRRLVDAVLNRKADLAIPRFRLEPTAGLVNAAILYPLTRALFGVDVRFPLAVDAALSARAVQRLGVVASRRPQSQEAEALLWPVAECAVGALSVQETDAGRAHPAAPAGDFNNIFVSVTGSLFADIEIKANFWQRARALSARVDTARAAEGGDGESQPTAQIREMVDSFQLAHANLQEIWSMVLSPQTRLALKKLSVTETETFSVEPALWARIVYDFALAFHQRTLNRGHLLGAMTPLYLAWAAGHLRAAGDDAIRAAQGIEDTAAAFETERPYMLSRWRWPDRFNP